MAFLGPSFPGCAPSSAHPRYFAEEKFCEVSPLGEPKSLKALIGPIKSKWSEIVAELSRNRIAWNYTDDEGSTWRVAAMKAMTDQAKLGGSASNAGVKEKPSHIRMRRATVSNSAGHSRVVPVYEVSAAITVAGETINCNRGLDSEAYTSNGGFIPEFRPRRNVTKQTA